MVRQMQTARQIQMVARMHIARQVQMVTRIHMDDRMHIAGKSIRATSCAFASTVQPIKSLLSSP